MREFECLALILAFIRLNCVFSLAEVWSGRFPTSETGARIYFVNLLTLLRSNTTIGMKYACTITRRNIGQAVLELRSERFPSQGV